MTVEPTGASHEVPLDDLFFSTTDARGVIDEANEVFTRNARYPRERLIGAPHNVIRHPDMPGGLFRLMWDQLGLGEPVTAYVLNLAGDGSAYWAFATVVPIGDRFLSVRSSPRNLAARDLVHGLYAEVRAAERRARDEDGSSAVQAAEHGRDLLAAAMTENGFASYADLQLDLVPQEVAARDAAGPTRPRPKDVTKPLRPLVTHALAAQDMLAGFADALTQSLARADDLARDLRRLRQPLATVADSPLSAEVVAQAAGLLRARAGDLADRLVEVIHTRKRLRFTTAIARLQAEAVTRYVVAVGAGAEDPRISERALASLTEALLTILEADLDADAEATGPFADRVAALADSLTTLAGTVAAMTPPGTSPPATNTPAVDAPEGLLPAEPEDQAHERRVLAAAGEGLTDLAERCRRGATALRDSTAALDREALSGELAEVVAGAAVVG